MSKIVQWSHPMGDFGNQLFQYAFVKSYAHLMGAELQTIPWIGQKLFTNIDDKPISKPLPQTQIDTYVWGEVNIDMCGFFMHKEALSIMDMNRIREWYTFKQEIVDQYPRRKDYYIAAHVRNKLPDYAYLVCTVSKESYYLAIEKYGLDKTKLVWVEKPTSPEEASRPGGYGPLLVDCPYEGYLGDFFTLMNADVLLRSNSTYSWWAGSLGHGIIYSPVVEDKTGMHTVEFVKGNHPKVVYSHHFRHLFPCREPCDLNIQEIFMKISIVIPYHNRRELLLHTLQVMSQTTYRNIEVIIVDDGSNPENQLDDIVNNYWFPIKLLRIEEDQRWWKKDSCVCVNIGTEAATGDVLLLQQPECCYVGDVLEHLARRGINDKETVAYSCYTLNPSDTVLFMNGEPITYDFAPESTWRTREKSGWLNHPILIPTGNHYCLAVTRRTWEILGGMDMDYAEGFACCDTDLREKVWFRGFQMVIPRPETAPFVVHLCHPVDYLSDDTQRLFDINSAIFDKKQSERQRYINLLQSLGIAPTCKCFTVE